MLKPQFVHLLVSIFFVLIIKVMIWKILLLTFITFENQIHNMNEICCCLDHVHLNLIGNLVSPL